MDQTILPRRVALALQLMIVLAVGVPVQAARAAQEPAPKSQPSSGGLHPQPRYAAPEAEARATDATTESLGCVAATLNPGLDDDGYFWDNYYAPTVVTDSDVYYSPPSSFRLVEDADLSTDPRAVGVDDAFGQFFYVPTSTRRIAIGFNVAYQASTINPADGLNYFLYSYNETATAGESILGDLLFQSRVADQEIGQKNDNGWYTVRDTFGDGTDEQERLASLAGQLAVLVVGTVTNGKSPFLNVWVDDVEASVCDSVGGATVSGQIADSLVNSPRDAQLLLTYTDPTGAIVTLDTVAPADDGSYSFRNVSNLGAGYYQVWFQNDGVDDRRLDRWASAKIPSVVEGSVVTAPFFDIANIDIGIPGVGAGITTPELTLPATFTWTTRVGRSEQYKLCLADLLNSADVCTDPISGGEATITADDLGQIFSNGFAFEYGRPYGWYLQIVGPEFNNVDFADTGFALEFNEVMFVQERRAEPVQNASLIAPIGDEPGAQQKKWTVMLYMAGDNDLSSPIYTDNLRDQYATLQKLAQMPEISKLLNLVALTDFDENGDTRFCNLTSPTPCELPGADDKEKDTASPLVLTNFISSTLAAPQFAADHTMLIISSHAHMVNGVTIDETTPGAPSMTPRELREAIGSGLKPSGKKLDVLFYYACLMGGIEAAFDASANADYLVASADQAWVINFYDRLLAAIVANADSPREVAKAIVGAYREKMAQELPGLFTSIAAYDLSRAASVRSALSGLAEALRQSALNVEPIRNAVQVYDSSGDDLLNADDAFVDIRDLAERLAASENASVTSAAQKLLAALGKPGAERQAEGTPLVVASAQVSGISCVVQRDLSRASGLAVYFPSKNNYLAAELNSYRREYQSFNTDNSWDDFVVGYINKTPARAPTSRRRAGLPLGGAVPSCGNIWLPALMRR